MPLFGLAPAIAIVRIVRALGFLVRAWLAVYCSAFPAVGFVMKILGNLKILDLGL
jgi:hypothetical protein